jgi:hypothetical protein
VIDQKLGWTMADAKTDKTIKKDQHSSRDDRQEVEEEIRSSGTKPGIKNPNRDRARGDWDRSKGGT